MKGYKRKEREKRKKRTEVKSEMIVKLFCRNENKRKETKYLYKIP